MAHFAELGLNNTVLRVIVVHNNELLDENGVEQEQRGADFCRNLLGGTWVQTSYNGTTRKNFAGVGFIYDSQRDAFIPPKPFDDWVLDEETCRWEDPALLPEGTIVIELGDITLEEPQAIEDEVPAQNNDADAGNDDVVILNDGVYSGNDNDNDSVILTE